MRSVGVPPEDTRPIAGSHQSDPPRFRVTFDRRAREYRYV
jgi:hypothetical protein